MADDGPCFDPTCPCCKTHTALERRYEDSLDAIRHIAEKMVRACWHNRHPLTREQIKTYVDRIKQHLTTAGR